MGATHKPISKLNNYLREGITWRRLQAISVKPLAEGGLAMFREDSPEFASVFKEAPGKLIENRPECDACFLGWLKDRELALAPLVENDVVDRQLGEDAQVAVETMETHQLRIAEKVAHAFLLGERKPVRVRQYHIP